MIQVEIHATATEIDFKGLSIMAASQITEMLKEPSPSNLKQLTGAIKDLVDISKSIATNDKAAAPVTIVDDL